MPTDYIKKNIINALKKYFEADDNGNANSEYDPNFSAQDAIDEIHCIVGKI